MTAQASSGRRAVDHRVDGGLVLITLAGPLDIYTVPAVRRELEEHGTRARIVLDLSEVTLIDAAGLGLLAGLSARAERDGLGRLGLICPDRRLRRAFDIAGLRGAFAFGDDLARVRAAVREPR